MVNISGYHGSFEDKHILCVGSRLSESQVSELGIGWEWESTGYAQRTGRGKLEQGILRGILKEISVINDTDSSTKSGSNKLIIYTNLVGYLDGA